MYGWNLLFLGVLMLGESAGCGRVGHDQGKPACQFCLSWTNSEVLRAPEAQDTPKEEPLTSKTAVRPALASQQTHSTRDSTWV